MPTPPRFIVGRETQMFGGDATIKLGFQFDQRTKVADERNLVVNTAAQFTAIGIPTDYNQFSLNDPFAGKIAMGYTFRYFDQAKMRQYATAARSQFALAPVTANNYDVRERVYAGFAMGTLRYDWGSVVGGVRVEHVANRGIAVATVGTTTGPVTAESGQTLAFPSLHINYNVDDTKKLRLSFNSGAARADYDQLRPNVVVNDPNQTISGGNPAVKPERAYGVDGYFEWYVRPQGYLMVGAFYKKVEDVLYRQSRTFGSDALNSAGVDRSAYVFTGITNGGGGRVFGVEAAAQLQLDPWTASLGLPDVDGRIRHLGQRHGERQPGHQARDRRDPGTQGAPARHVGPRLQPRRLLRKIRPVVAPAISAPQSVARYDRRRPDRRGRHLLGAG